MTIRRPRRHDDELPELPPLDGDANEPPIDQDIEIEGVDEPTSLDDTAADDLDVGSDFDELPPEEDVANDNQEGPGGPAEDDADDVAILDTGSWVGDEADERGDVDDIDHVADLAPDDRGEEGPETDQDPYDLDMLPPLDDDPDGDVAFSELDAHEPVAVDDHAPPAFRLPLSAPATVRVLRGSDPSLGVALGTALGVALGRDRLLVVGDAVTAVRLDALDETDATLHPLRAPDVDELFTSVAEREDGGLVLGSLTGNLYRQAHDRDAWRKAGALDPRAPGAVELLSDGDRVWARTAHGALHRSDGGQWFEGPVLRDVTAFTVDPHGGVLAAVAPRGRHGLRASTDGRAWATVALPEGGHAGSLARAGDVCVIASGGAAAVGFVSVTGGKQWARWELLAGATALALGETDDGVACVFFAAQHPTERRAVLVTARIGPDGEARAPRRLADLDAILAAPREGDHDEDDGDEASEDDVSDRVLRVLPLDRAGRRLVLLTARGALYRVDQED